MTERCRKQKSAVERSLRKHLDSFHSASPMLKRVMKYAVFSGGKRIRPILVLESCRACGGTVSKAAPIACAIELVHNFSLVHDDLPSMDNDSFRRGKPTCHKKFGEALALLAGDALLNLAYGIIARIKDKKVSQAITKEVSDAVGSNGMIGGQVLDISYEGKEVTRNRQELINRLKTAGLFAASLKAGAIASGASAGKTLRMRRFGTGLGLAFQTVDDIMDRKYSNSPVLEQKRREVRRLIKGAKNNLKGFDSKADGLRNIADYIAGTPCLHMGNDRHQK